VMNLIETGHLESRGSDFLLDYKADRGRRSRFTLLSPVLLAVNAVSTTRVIGHVRLRRGRSPPWPSTCLKRIQLKPESENNSLI
jgi:hypothetical protein